MTDITAHPIRIAAFYHFAPLPDPQALALEMRVLGKEQGLLGSIIMAHEGVNGTIAGTHAAMEAAFARLRAVPGFEGLKTRDHGADEQPFVRWKIKVKPEIVTMGELDIDANDAGTHVPPAEWNALISDPDTILIDARNDYEIEIGHFEGAIDPQTRSFGAFPQWFDTQAEQWRAEGRKPRIAMYCTGGIRCEKSTALAKARGFDDVYHLKGGILAYLAEIEEQDSLWRGECFLFDDRVSITHGEQLGKTAICVICGLPVTSPADGGISPQECVRCADLAD